MVYWLLSLFINLFFSKPYNALKAKELNLLIIDEAYSFSPIDYSIFSDDKWFINPPNNYEFIYFHIKRPQFITKIFLQTGSKKQKVFLYTNLIHKPDFKDDTFQINSYPAILLFVIQNQQDNDVEVVTAKGIYHPNFGNSKNFIKKIQIFNKNLSYTVFLLRRPQLQHLKKYVELDDSLAIGLNTRYFFALKLRHNGTDLLITYRKQNLLFGTFFQFRNSWYRRQTVKTRFYYDRYFIYTPLGKVMYRIPDSAFVQPNQLDPDIITDIRYATQHNFTHHRLYSCARCWLRYKVARDLVAAEKAFENLGYRIVLFDCYRPVSVQIKMWNYYPNRNYVAPPSHGSMHNRGVAVDLSLAKLDGTPLNMGTGFDYFGPKAHSDYKDLPAQVLYNRKLLRNILKMYNFHPIRTEWWHFYHTSFKQFRPLDLDLCQSVSR